MCFSRRLSYSLVSITGLYIVIDVFNNLDEFLGYAREKGSLITVLADYYGALERYSHASTFNETLAAKGKEIHRRLCSRCHLPPDDPDVGETVAELVDGYLAERESEVKAGTLTHMQHTRRNLVDYFGANKPIASITTGDALAWRRNLLKKGLAENTVRRRCAIARQFFRVALRKGLIQANPFADMAGLSVRGNKAREHFVTANQNQWWAEFQFRTVKVLPSQVRERLALPVRTIRLVQFEAGKTK